jgi:hypothetical protein
MESISFPTARAAKSRQSARMPLRMLVLFLLFFSIFNMCVCFSSTPCFRVLSLPPVKPGVPVRFCEVAEGEGSQPLPFRVRHCEMKGLAVLLVVAAAVCAALGQRTSTSDLDDLKKPVLLSGKDFKVLVLTSKIPWVILFQKGADIPEAAQTLATELDAISRVGIINTASTKDSLLTDLVMLGCQLFVPPFYSLSLLTLAIRISAQRKPQHFAHTRTETIGLSSKTLRCGHTYTRTHTHCIALTMCPARAVCQ